MTVFKGDELRGFQSTVAAIFERGNGAKEANSSRSIFPRLRGAV